MKKVAMILYGNIRYDGRVQKEINTLKINGKEIILFASEFDEDDKFENYNFQIEIVKNIFPKKGGLFTLLNMLFFNIFVYKKLKNLRVDYIHCNDLNTLMIAKNFSKIGKVVFDAHELFPESQESKLKKIFWNFIEKTNIKYVYKIIQPESNRRKYFANKYNLKSEQIALIENFPLKKELDISKGYFIKKYGYKTGKKIALYIGVIMKKRNILEILQVIKSNEELVFFCVGKCSDISYKKELESFVKENNMEERVFFKESIPQKEVLEATNSADITFIFYQNINLNNYYCASNKLYEALNCGVKILTNDYPGIILATKNIPNVYRVKNMTIEELKKGINYLLNEKEIKKTEFYWEDQEEEFIKIYSE